MTDKKLTDSEIVKALECCNTEYDNYQCPHCPLLHKGCKKALIKDALDLINRLQKENENYSKNNQTMTNDILKLYKGLEQAKAENERLKLELADTKRDLQIVLDNSISAKLPHCVLCGKGAILTKTLEEYHELISNISAEAYKEFAEKVEDEIYCQPHSKGMLESAERSRIIRIINSVLKELVGEDNG